jgi:arylsulfatase A-like enzyme
MRPGWGNLQLFGAGKPMEELREYKIVQEGIAGMERFAGKQQPWCVMVSNNGGHDLYDPPQRFLDMYDWRTIELPKNFRDRMADKPRIYQRMRLQYWEQLSDDEVKQAITHYYALLTMQDELFGMLLKALEKTGEAENTLVIYCSDHGDYAGAHGLWAKGVPSFREGYNIPCAVRWPKGIAQPGRVLEPLVSTADFAPTILEAAGIHGPKMTGASLCSWFGPDKPSPWRDTIFSQLNGVEVYYTQRIVMTHTHKYVYNGFDFDEFYDLTNDPYELVNLAFPGNAPEPALLGRATREFAEA